MKQDILVGSNGDGRTDYLVLCRAGFRFLPCLALFVMLCRAGLVCVTCLALFVEFVPISTSRCR